MAQLVDAAAITEPLAAGEFSEPIESEATHDSLCAVWTEAVEVED